VTIHPREALKTKNLLSDEDGKVSQAREETSLQDIPATQWWWD
jgi:hypothetical protein